MQTGKTIFEKHFYKAEGVRMRYFTAGAGAPLLFLHGGGVRAMTYIKNLELFAQKFFVIAPDIPPFGASSMPPAMWDFNDYARYLDGFMNSLALSNGAVIGHSFGGGIALCLARHSKCLSRCIIVDAAGVSFPSPLTFYLHFFVWKRLRNLRQGISLTCAMDRDIILTLAHNFRHIPRGFRMVDSAMQPRYEDVFQGISIPSLVLWGSQDELFPPEDARRLAAAIRGSRLEMVTGNHDWCLFRPEVLQERVTRFVYG